MIRVQQLKLNTSHTAEELEAALLKALRITKKELISYEITKFSIDARKKPLIKFVYTIDAEVRGEAHILKKNKNANVTTVTRKQYVCPPHGDTLLGTRPVVIGTGPAGLFCGLLLAKQGYRPILLERGESVEERAKTVEHFWTTGELNENSNVQFGEGGAGTFSDGKLNTVVKDPVGRNRYVMELFIAAGAPEEIRYQSQPHIGTDVLRNVVRNMRNEIISLGGEVRFQSQVTDILVKDGRIRGVEINHREQLDAEAVVLAIGHSARDTFEMLNRKPLIMTQKAFAVGVRIEHSQKMINKAMYGCEEHPDLPTANYKLTRQLTDGRGVYSFCMCPGGYVVNASSEQGRCAVNGMSYYGRDGRNANSAMVVTVTPDDFGSEDVLAGMHFQRKLEEAAWRAGEGNIPVQLLGDFCDGVKSSTLGSVEPAIKGQWQFSDLRNALPEFMGSSLAQGICQCENSIHGFSAKDAVLSGVESRTSSPVRILRNEAFESAVEGLYPCGEGAGYAGGITSAAIDGLKVAEAIVRKYSNP